MKRMIPLFVVVGIVIAIVLLFFSLATTKRMVVIKEGNLQKIPLEITLHLYQDSDCGMVIESLDYASQVVAPDGKTWFFHDHGGFVNWLKDKSFEQEATIWVMSRDTHRWIDARRATYSQNEITPMGYGFGAYEKPKENSIDFETMRLRVLHGETLNNPLIRKQILGE
ncbi:MAG: hypothetical protein IE916_05930 [Epsilonproteobacteria bacterium]|nr:hypothetical protein [Campylobacterota bacterium]